MWDCCKRQIGMKPRETNSLGRSRSNRKKTAVASIRKVSSGTWIIDDGLSANICERDDDERCHPHSASLYTIITLRELMVIELNNGPPFEHFKEIHNVIKWITDGRPSACDRPNGFHAACDETNETHHHHHHHHHHEQAPWWSIVASTVRCLFAILISSPCRVQTDAVSSYLALFQGGAICSCDWFHLQHYKSFFESF